MGLATQGMMIVSTIRKGRGCNFHGWAGGDQGCFHLVVVVSHNRDLLFVLAHAGDVLRGPSSLFPKSARVGVQLLTTHIHADEGI